eukprot:RCo046988
MEKKGGDFFLPLQSPAGEVAPSFRHEEPSRSIDRATHSSPVLHLPEDLEAALPRERERARSLPGANAESSRGNVPHVEMRERTQRRPLEILPSLTSLLRSFSSSFWRRQESPEAVFYCQLCRSRVPLTRKVMVPGCEHIFCRGCLVQHIVGAGVEGRSEVRCPGAEGCLHCLTVLSEAFVEGLLYRNPILERRTHEEFGRHQTEPIADLEAAPSGNVGPVRRTYSAPEQHEPAFRTVTEMPRRAEQREVDSDVLSSFLFLTLSSIPHRSRRE